MSNLNDYKFLEWENYPEFNNDFAGMIPIDSGGNAPKLWDVTVVNESSNSVTLFGVYVEQSRKCRMDSVGSGVTKQVKVIESATSVGLGAFLAIYIISSQIRPVISVTNDGRISDGAVYFNPENANDPVQFVIIRANNTTITFTDSQST